MLNKVFLIGRLTATPEIKYTTSNKAYTRFSLAVDNRFNQGTDFINVVVWNKQAENVCNYLEKGSLVMVEGNISVSNYEDKEGNKRTMTDIVAQNIQFLSKKQSTNETQQETTNFYEETDPFADFGETVETDDDYLE